MNGRIERALSPTNCASGSDLRHAAARQRAPRRRLRRLMAYHPFRHLGLKVVALACASLLWLTVAGEHVVERILRVPVEFRNIPQQLEWSAIRRTASRSGCAARRPCSAGCSRRRRGVVDLQLARPGSRLFPSARRSAVAIRRRGRAGHAGHARHRAREARAAMVPVVRRLEGDPRRVRVRAITAEPATVEIAGPESRVKKIANATTEPVSVRGAGSTSATWSRSGLIDSACGCQAAGRHRHRRRAAGAGRARAEGVLVRARNLGSGLARRRCAGLGDAVGARPPGGAAGVAPRPSTPSSTLPASGPASTIFGFRSIHRSTSGRRDHPRVVDVTSGRSSSTANTADTEPMSHRLFRY
jgi:hypothetical protein